MRYLEICIFLVLFTAAGCKGSENTATDTSVTDLSTLSDLKNPEPDRSTMVDRFPILTVVYDNYQAKPGQSTKTDWGFACAISGVEKGVLFDTGADNAILTSNISSLEVDPKGLETVVLSHEHSDHIGGLDAVLEKNSDIEVVLLSSFPAALKQEVAKRAASVVEISGARELFGGVHTVGTMGTTPPEQALAIDTQNGVVVLTGCAHPGIIEIVKKAKQLTQRPILLVMGGFHLQGKARDELAAIADELLDLGVRYAGPTHCSGDVARSVFRQKFQERFLEIGVGAVVSTVDLEP